MASFEHTLNTLMEAGDQRVWSLIITLFGDMAQSSVINGQQISRITGRLGIKPEATRVALHRLRKDGWISSRKSGRISLHRLTEPARKQSAIASVRIYQQDKNPPAKWHMLLASHRGHDQHETLLKNGYLALGKSAYVKKGCVAKTYGCLAIDAGQGGIPDWARAALYPAELVSMAAVFSGLLDKIPPAGFAAFTAIETVALRVLLVHIWRKIILRAPDLPAAFFPENWQGEACRMKVFSMLEALPRPTLADI